MPPPMAEALPTHRRPPDPGLVCLAIVCGLHNLLLDPEHLTQEHAPDGKPLDALGLTRAAKRIGLRARVAKADPKRLAQLPLPAIAEAAPQPEASAETAAPAPGFFVLARIAEGQALIQRPGQAPQALPLDQLMQVWTGRLVQVAHREAVAGDDRRFGFSWFVPVLVRYRRMFGEVLAISLLLQLFGLVTPLVFQTVIDKVLVHHGLTTLDVLVIGLLAMALFDATLNFIRSYLLSHTAQRVDVELGMAAFRHMIALPLIYFQSRPAGQTVARLREMESIRAFLTGSALTALLDVLFTGLMLSAMLMYSPLLTAVVVGAMPVHVLMSALLTPAIKKRTDEKFQCNAQAQSFLVECVTGAETLKALAVEPRLRHRWDELLAAAARANFGAARLGLMGQQGVALVGRLVTAGTLWLGAHAVLDGDMTIGMMTAFNLLSGQVNQPMLRLAQLWQDVQQLRTSVKKVGDVLNTPPEAGLPVGSVAPAAGPKPGPARMTMPPVRGEIRFDAVAFRYGPEGRPALRDLDLVIPAGQVVGVVGRSGSGKSTLGRLAERLYTPDHGRVLIDGIDLSLVDPASLRRQVGVVLQENFLMNTTVRENIALTDPTMPIGHVMELATLAGAHDFITDLPKGYDTPVGERGGNLSGGQRQRIAIARALAADPKILIFDEATSALDYESELAIHAQMRRICRGRTVILIAHRLSTIRYADRVITLDGGRLVEDGPPERLAVSGGFFAGLMAQQRQQAAVRELVPA